MWRTNRTQKCRLIFKQILRWTDSLPNRRKSVSLKTWRAYIVQFLCNLEIKDSGANGHERICAKYRQPKGRRSERIRSVKTVSKQRSKKKSQSALTSLSLERQAPFKKIATPESFFQLSPFKSQKEAVQISLVFSAKGKEHVAGCDQECEGIHHLCFLFPSMMISFS